MGDTGSFALGGAIAGFAVVTGTEILLPLIAGIFVIEVLSLIIQVVSFKRTGKRVFLIAPIHHHFEMKAWSETKIMVRFWIVCAIFCASGFALFYRDFLQFVHPEMNRFELGGRRVLVVGLARSGVAAAEALLAQGSHVVGFDRNEALDAEGSGMAVSKFTSEARRRRCYRGSISS